MVSDVTLEDRVTPWEKLVDELRHKADTSGYKKDWRRTVGMYEGDPVMQERIGEGQHIH